VGRLGALFGRHDTGETCRRFFFGSSPGRYVLAVLLLLLLPHPRGARLVVAKELRRTASSNRRSVLTFVKSDLRPEE